MKSKIIIISLAIIGFYLGGHYIYYGSFTRNCIFTEKILPTPEQLAKGEIVVVKDAYLAVGYDKLWDYTCLKTFGSIDREIVEPADINPFGTGIGRDHFIDSGLTVVSLKKGTSFHVVDIIEVTKHGITTIDSGPGPSYYLILKDNNNISYQISTASLGGNKEDLFLSFVDSSKPASTSSVKLLDYNSFDHPGDREGVDTFRYTGKLTELTNTYLEETEPLWKKLSDRLERGEKVSIMVKLDYFKKIKFSDNQEERFRQVAQIQDEFLKKIPPNIRLVNIEKDKIEPYISMEANLDLLNYLFYEQMALKIRIFEYLKL